MAKNSADSKWPNGLRVDPEEFYLKVNNEYVGILQDGKGNLEIKLLTALGYNQSENDQIEMGLDYRAKNLIGSGMESNKNVAVLLSYNNQERQQWPLSVNSSNGQLT